MATTNSQIPTHAINDGDMTPFLGRHNQLLASGLVPIFDTYAALPSLSPLFRHHFGTTPEVSIEECLGSCSRSKLLLALTELLNPAIDEASVRHLAVSVELFHQASLIVDDVQDGARRRKGRDTLWSQFGEVPSVLFAHQLLFEGILKVDQVVGPQGVAEVIAASRKMLEGQTSDMKANFGRSESNYENIAQLKTGTLYGLAGHLAIMTVKGTASDIAGRLVGLLLQAGIAHQAVDDMRDAVNLDVNLAVFDSMEMIWRNIRQSLFSIEAIPREEDTLNAFISRNIDDARRRIAKWQDKLDEELRICRLPIMNMCGKDQIAHWDQIVSSIIRGLGREDNAL